MFCLSHLRAAANGAFKVNTSVRISTVKLKHSHMLENMKKHNKKKNNNPSIQHPCKNIKYININRNYRSRNIHSYMYTLYVGVFVKMLLYSNISQINNHICALITSNQKLFFLTFSRLIFIVLHKQFNGMMFCFCICLSIMVIKYPQSL